MLNLFPFGPDDIDLNDYVIGNVFTNNAAARPIQIYPTNLSHNFIGTGENEAFNGDSSGASGAFSFDGAGGDDRAWGGGDGDSFSGGNGSDQLFGLGGDDTLDGGIGNDVLDGGNDTDTALIGDGPVYFDTAIGWLATSTEGSDFLIDVEIAIDGTGQRSLLVGSTGFDTLQQALDVAQDGDTIRLADGTYSGTVTYEVSNLTVIAAATAILNATFTTAGGFAITVLAGNDVDNITLGTGDDTINGGGGNDTLNAGFGHDSIDGGIGADTMNGELGNDTYIVDNVSDTVTESSALGGTDLVQSSVTFILASNIENLTLTGLNAVNGTGNNLANNLVGNNAANILNGGFGADTMQGGLGNDTYVIDNAGDVVTEAAGAGTDTVQSSLNHTLGANFERLVLTGTGNTTGTGNGAGQHHHRQFGGQRHRRRRRRRHHDRRRRQRLLLRRQRPRPGGRAGRRRH